MRSSTMKPAGLLMAMLVTALAAGPARAADELRQVQAFQMSDKMPGLLVAGGVYQHGDYLYVNGIFPRKLSVFRRDGASGLLAYVGMWDYDPEFLESNKARGSQHKFVHWANGAGDLVYLTGQTFHASPDNRFGRSFGLHTYRIDPKTGMTTHLGAIKCGHGRLMTAHGGKVLYQFEQFPQAIHWYRIGDDGLPVHAGQLSGKGLITDGHFERPGRVPAAIAPDEKFLYGVSAAEMAVGWARVADDGSLTYGGSIDVKGPLKLELESNTDIYTGFLPDQTLIPADGRHLYLAFRYKGVAAIATFARDADSGALKPAGLQHLGAPAKSIRLVAFAPDGISGFYASPGKDPLVGHFTRDPDSGKLTEGPTLSLGNDARISAIAVDPAGKVCYVSDNGGHKSGGLRVIRFLDGGEDQPSSAPAAGPTVVNP